MTRRADTGIPRDALGARLRALLQSGDVDAALQAGLMDYVATHDADDAPIRAIQEQLRTAQDARARYRSREARLSRRAAERAARRAPRAEASIVPGPEAEAPVAASVPGLPAAAAAALARARARPRDGRTDEGATAARSRGNVSPRRPRRAGRPRRARP
ncbi:hypothetical protein H1235_05660 [Pseudoxanthomonas sp. NC8]|nr:hypothetical protein H1235_05660 [Pseudoxanthomonas sp. NC8]